MEPIKYYDDVQITNFVKIPVGGYNCYIKSAKDVTVSGNRFLKMAIDILDGEFKDYYKNQFESNKKLNADTVWKGIYDLFIPLENDKSDINIRTIKSFKMFINAVEMSNPGYRWDWKEQLLAGKHFGGVFGEVEFKAQDGTYKLFTKCRYAVPIDSIKNNDYKIPNILMTKEHKGMTYSEVLKLENNTVLSGYRENLSVQAVNDESEEIPF